MRRLLLIMMIAFALVAVPAVVFTPSAEAATRTCAWRSDYNRVRNGQTATTVTRLLHNRGRLIFYRSQAWSPIRSVTIRKYPVCTRRTGAILVTFINGRVRIKRAFW